MATWGPLRRRLDAVEGQVTLSWADLDALVGGLPPSAYRYDAFWKGDRSGWRGFGTVDVRVGESVTFVRRHAAPGPRTAPAPYDGDRPPSSAPDVILVGCVKRKRAEAAPAQDLYTSSLFRKERAYAEAASVPWFILSAEHGLVAPETVLEPYDLRLSATPRDYRSKWGRRVVAELQEQLGSVHDRVFEIHAGASYVDAIEPLLRALGAEVVAPLRGLSMGERLRWYGPSSRRVAPSHDALPTPEVAELVGLLAAESTALTPEQLLATDGSGLRSPGLYSWWVDARGAADLSRGLGLDVQAGLIYAGLAGATRSRSGRRSTNTLWGRINGMHLGGRHEFSTFRLSLGSILAEANGSADIDEEGLTSWMHEHLRVIPVPVGDGDSLDALETEVLAALDPPLNLSKMPRTAVRSRLTELRREHGRRSSQRAANGAASAT